MEEKRDYPTDRFREEPDARDRLLNLIASDGQSDRHHDDELRAA